MTVQPVRKLTAILLVAVFAISACAERQFAVPPPSPTSSAQPGGTFPNWPKNLDEFRFHWTAKASIDLTSGVAVAIRAYIESYRVVNMAGADITRVYPGFLRSTPENMSERDDNYLVELGGVRPKTRAEEEALGWVYKLVDMYGYSPVHILNINQVGESYDAIVCLGEYATFVRDENTGKYRSLVSEVIGDDARRGIAVWRVQLRKDDVDSGPDAAAAELTSQVGPLPAPVEDVFGPWFIEKASYTLWGPRYDAEWVPTLPLWQKCGDVMPDDVSVRRAMFGEEHDQPPAHGEAIPGWPAKAK